MTNKVPPLKIIYSNPNGGHPYVKPIDATKQQRLGKKKEDESGLSSSEGATNLETPKSKQSRTLRVSSPITTIATKTTPRRAAAVASAAATAAVSAGRSSPATQITSLTLKSLSADLNNPLNSTTESENIIRRKLRSHTRQLQVGDTIDTKPTGPSPVTVQSELGTELVTQEIIENKSSAEVVVSIEQSVEVTEPDNVSSKKKRTRQPNSEMSNEGESSQSSLTQSETNSSSIDAQQNNQMPNTISMETAPNPQSTTESINAQLQINILSSSNCIKKYVDIKNEVFCCCCCCCCKF